MMNNSPYILKNKLRETRKKKKINQTLLAESALIDQSQYSRKERGEVKIHDEEWDRLAKALGVNRSEIYEEEPKVIKIVNNTDNKDQSINGFEISIKVPKNIFENLSTKLDLVIDLLKQKLI